MTDTLLERFRQAYRNLEAFPLLEDGEIRQFRVDFGEDTIEDLEQAVIDSSSTQKFLFAGHRGCGKSTLLARFCQKHSIADQFFVVSFSIADITELPSVDHVNILFSIGVKLMERAEQLDIQIDPDIKENFYDWLAEETQVKEQKLSVGGGINLLNIIQLKIQTDRNVRRTLKDKYERDISTLVQRLEHMDAVIRSVTSKETLIVIDDLDKLDLGLVENIYKDNVKSLFKPKFRVIFTLPIAVIRTMSLKTVVESELGRRVDLLTVPKLFPRGSVRQSDAVPIQENVNVLREALYRRIPMDLVDDTTVTDMVLLSGGLLRELIRIARECCSRCLIKIRRDPDKDRVILNREVLTEAIRDLRNDYAAPLGNQQYEILQTTYETFYPPNASDQMFLDLLHGLYVLEYRNDDLWYDIHPIILDLLRRKGMVT